MPTLSATRVPPCYQYRQDCWPGGICCVLYRVVLMYSFARRHYVSVDRIETPTCIRFRVTSKLGPFSEVLTTHNNLLIYLANTN